MPGQKYLIWQIPCEHEWEMLANLLKRLSAFRCNDLLHVHKRPQLSLQAASGSPLKSKFLSGHFGGEGAADRQATGTWYINNTGGKRDILSRKSSVKAPSIASEQIEEILLLKTNCLSWMCKREIQHKICWDLGWDSNLMSLNHSWFESLTETLSQFLDLFPAPACLCFLPKMRQSFRLPPASTAGRGHVPSQDK